MGFGGESKGEMGRRRERRNGRRGGEIFIVRLASRPNFFFFSVHCPALGRIRLSGLPIRISTRPNPFGLIGWSGHRLSTIKLPEYGRAWVRRIQKEKRTDNFLMIVIVIVPYWRVRIYDGLCWVVDILIFLEGYRESGG